MTRENQIIEYPVDCFLVKYPPVAVLEIIVFERFELQAFLIRNVPDRDGAEIGETGAGTDGCKFRILYLYRVISLRKFVFERLNRFLFLLPVLFTMFAPRIEKCNLDNTYLIIVQEAYDKSLRSTPSLTSTGPDVYFSFYRSG